MAQLWNKVSTPILIGLYTMQWVLNVAWNPIFFKFHWVIFGLIVITSLTLLVTYFTFHFQKALGWTSAMIWPYFIWLLIATSLNGYVVFMN